MFVRWDQQTVENDERARLPGHADTAVVRRFKAPEALDTRFYEVRAKSALNRIPPSSRVPFPWTVNPYRGCSHACTYCAAGDTPVLLADGTHRALEAVEVGDRIYGTVRRGAYLRYETTEVLDKWISIKPAYRVVLEDGTELVASGDHRFLSDRGWKHVAAASQGQRPYLTPNNKLMGTGAFAAQPVESRDYVRGYLTGMIRGDANLAEYEYATGRVYRFRLALADLEALQRSRRYLQESAVATDEFLFAAAGGSHREIRAIRELIAWPRRTPIDWAKGFLAGAFDAEGGCSRGVLRIANGDPRFVDWIAFSLRRLGLPHVIERPRDGMWNVRLRGGLEQQLRFFHLTDPAISRKRTIEGRAVKSRSRLGVVAIEPLGEELPLYDITTGTGDFIANGVVSHNCFARPTHEYLEFDAGRDFEKEIVVKVNVPEVLRKELARPSWKGEHIAMGTNTDPYQWVEGRYKLMRGIWEALRDFANPCSILTKSPLLLRDLDLMKEVAAVADLSACLSVPTLDEKAWRASEPHTPHPRARLEAVGELNAAGIPTGILIAPLMPGINDDPAQVEKIIELATENGAVSIGGNTLFLRGSVRRIFMDWLEGYRPDLVPRYEKLYAGGRAYVAEPERRKIERTAGLPGKRLTPYTERFRRRAGMRPPEPQRPARVEVKQGTLF
jgi:DNA repair photolyase